MSSMLTNWVPEHATSDSSDKPRILVAVVHGGPAGLVVEVELQAAMDSDGTAQNKEHKRVENGCNKRCNEDLEYSHQ